VTALSPLERIRFHLSGERRGITRAPLAFAIAIIAVIVGAYLAVSARRENNVLRAELAAYKEKLGGASPDEVKAALETLEKEVSTLEARLKPRRLAAHQRQVIADRAKPPAGAQYALALVHEGGCWDCPQYAADFGEIFRAIPGWLISNRVTMGLPERPPHGLAILVGDPAHLSAQEAMLLRALQAAAVEFDIAPAQSGLDKGPELLFAAVAPQ
jgi:hypothetical protein